MVHLPADFREGEVARYYFFDFVDEEGAFEFVGVGVGVVVDFLRLDDAEASLHSCVVGVLETESPDLEKWFGG